MKKTIFLLLLLATSLFAKGRIYTGIGYSLYNEDYTDKSMEDVSLTDNALKFKIGYGVRKAYAVEFSLDYIDHSDYNTMPAIGSAKYAFSIALLKAFDFNTFFNPYLKVGFGAGIIDNLGKPEKSLTYGSFDLGGGVFIPLSYTYDIELAYEYKNATYQKENLDSALNNTSNINIFYIGINTRF